MTLAGGKIIGLAVLLWAAPGIGLRTLAQTPTNSAASDVSKGTAPGPRPAALTFLSSNSPVSLFRELLAMNFLERQKFLADRSPESRRLIQAKVREYESLKPDLRELRLRVTELRWYLWPLMNVRPADRAARLEHIPAEDRKLVEDRLKEWDKLTPEVRQELLENEAAIRYFTELQDQIGRPSPNISPARRQKLEEGVRQWQALPDEQRQEMMARFNQFFGLTGQEKERALNTLSEPERRQIEKTLRNFGQLPMAQRVRCIHSFEKFASLSTEEREQFLKNAERWKLMTPDQRQAWRELVSKMPPGLGLPPRPPGLRLKPPPLTNNGG
jgi:hypothetical protein